jgi:hypothetical protein
MKYIEYLLCVSTVLGVDQKIYKPKPLCPYGLSSVVKCEDINKINRLRRE